MLPVIIFSLILLSANSVVSHSTLFEDGMKNVVSDQMSEGCYKDVLNILKQNSKNFKDLFDELNSPTNEGNTLYAALTRNLPPNCIEEIDTFLYKEKKFFENVFKKIERSERSADLLDEVPHPIVVEWKNLQAIIGKLLDKKCLQKLEDILAKNKNDFEHLYIGTQRSARSADEMQEMMKNIVSIPKQFCHIFSNG